MRHFPTIDVRIVIDLADGTHWRIEEVRVDHAEPTIITMGGGGSFRDAFHEIGITLDMLKETE